MQQALSFSLFSIFDWFIFFFILVLTVASVIWGQLSKKNVKNESDQFLDLMLMGRKLTLPMFIATLVATWYGGIFGVAQIAFERGIYNFVTQGVFWYMAYISFALLIIPRIHKYKSLTLPDLVGKQYGPIAEKISAILNIINLIPIAYAISIGVLIQLFIPIKLPWAISIGVLFVLVYSIKGGFRAVVFSDLIQFFVMCLAVISVFAFSLYTYGFNQLDNLSDIYFDPTGGYGLLETLSWGLIAFTTLVDPNFYQRSFAAKDLKVAKKGILLSTVVWIIFDLSLTFGAMYAKSIMPEAQAKYGYFIYAVELLPHGLKGFFLAGIVATVLSTLDSYIFLAGSTISYDLMPKKYKTKVSIHHFGILFIGVLAIVFAISFDGKIKAVWKVLGSLSASCLLVPVTIAHFSHKKYTDLHFVVSSLSGAIVALSYKFSGLETLYQIDHIYFGVLASLISFLMIRFTVRSV